MGFQYENIEQTNVRAWDFNTTTQSEEKQNVRVWAFNMKTHSDEI